MWDTEVSLVLKLFVVGAKPNFSKLQRCAGASLPYEPECVPLMPVVVMCQSLKNEKSKVETLDVTSMLETES